MTWIVSQAEIKKNDLEQLEIFVKHKLHFPETNCDFCQKTYDEFGTEADCENCPFLNISEENLEAWNLYCAINNQFTYDFGALPLVFEIYNVECTRSEAKLLLEKLALIHDLIKEKQKQDGKK